MAESGHLNVCGEGHVTSRNTDMLDSSPGNNCMIAAVFDFLNYYTF